MNSLDVRILAELGKQPKTVTELAGTLGASMSYVSERLKKLEEKRIVEKKRKGKSVTASLREPYSIYLRKLADSHNLEMLLGGRRDTLLHHLLKPRSVGELEEETHLSKAQTYKDLRVLKQAGVILQKNGRYSINPRADDLIRLAELLGEGERYRGVEEGAIVLFRKGGVILKKAPQDVPLAGSPTAFSKFPETGIMYLPLHKYVIYPEKKLSLEEILVHTLLASETGTQMVMAAVFFLKNKQRIDGRTARELSKKYGVLESYLNMLSYLNSGRGDGFPPWTEFLEKAELYGIETKQSYEKNFLLESLNAVGGKVARGLDVYLIGGLNLILRGVKDSTKDVDVVLKSKKDFDAFKAALEKAGYGESAEAARSYRRLHPTTVMIRRGKPNLDLFVKVVCGGIELSGEMAESAEFFKQTGNLRINLLSREAIFVFKSVTDRVGDLEDARLLAVKHPLDWERMWGEVKSQEERSGKTFSFAFLDTLEVLEDKWSIVAPITGKVRFHCLKKGIQLALKKPKTIEELKDWVKFPRHSIERAVRELEGDGKIRVDRSKKPYVITLKHAP